MSETVKILSVVIPTYNMREYLPRCVDSVLLEGIREAIEVIIVNDGSKDDSLEIAQGYLERYPASVKVIDKENGGHGSAVNAGIEAATGVYVHVLDADDWFCDKSLKKLVRKLTEHYRAGTVIDAVITNYVYEKVYDGTRRAMRYTNALPQDEVFTPIELDNLKFYQFLGMHSLTYRTKLVKDCGLKLQHHTFYVDNEYAYIPIPYINTYIYFNVDLYRYFIGRPDQSVQLESCLKKIDHHERVTKRLLTYYDLSSPLLTDEKRRYMLKELKILVEMYGCILTLSPDPKDVVRKQEFFEWLKSEAPFVYRAIYSKLSIKILRGEDQASVATTRVIYKMLRNIFKFQ